MRRQHFAWTYLVIAIVLTLYGGFSIIYNVGKQKDVPVLGLVFTIIGILLGTLLMVVIAYCYRYMVNKVPDSGGIYSFVKHAFGGDHAFLASWSSQ